MSTPSLRAAALVSAPTNRSTTGSCVVFVELISRVEQRLARG
jgi:hypothetical protein